VKKRKRKRKRKLIEEITSERTLKVSHWSANEPTSYTYCTSYVRD